MFENGKRKISAVIPGLIMLPCLIACSSPLVKNHSPVDYRMTQATLSPEKEYVIQSGDQLDIKFFYNSELNESIIVRPDGRISLQLAEEIKAAGMTPAQLAALLEKTYSNELSEPKITVIVRSFNAQKVYVDGEINKPGLVNLTGQMTVLQSISQAGGLKDTAGSHEVIVIRKTPDQKPMPLVVNLDNVINGSDMNQDIVLMPYDIVYVPKSTIANVNKWVDQYIRKNMPIPVGFGFGIE